MTKKAVIMLSGGMDSLTCMAIAKDEGYACYALSFDYGQRHKVELEAAKHYAQNYAVVEHKIMPLPLTSIGGSAMTDNNIAVPEYDEAGGIPTSYVPARNTIFLSIALAWAEVLGADTILYGASAIDYSGYPDCRPEYVDAFQQMANLSNKIGVEGKPIRIYAPLINLSKADMVKTGIALGVDYSRTITCYQIDNEGRACGTCPSCVLRAKGFAEAGVEDITKYCVK